MLASTSRIHHHSVSQIPCCLHGALPSPSTGGNVPLDFRARLPPGNWGSALIESSGRREHLDILSYMPRASQGLRALLLTATHPSWTWHPTRSPKDKASSAHLPCHFCPFQLYSVVETESLFSKTLARGYLSVPYSSSFSGEVKTRQ